MTKKTKTGKKLFVFIFLIIKKKSPGTLIMIMLTVEGGGGSSRSIGGGGGDENNTYYHEYFYKISKLTMKRLWDRNNNEEMTTIINKPISKQTKKNEIKQ